jgi:peptidoglycan/xylan/chitin deacetylase (PgdA/CDA1 family)
VLALAGRDVPPRWVVLYYHGISARARSAFARQIQELARISVPVPAGRREGPAPGQLFTSVTFDDGFVSVVQNALPELRAHNIPSTVFVPSGCLGGRPSWLETGHADWNEFVMSPGAVRALSEQGDVTIGSHSVTHPNFRTLDDRAALAELETSKAALEAILGTQVMLFSFPHGAFNERSFGLARQARYGRVFTIEPTLADAERFVCGRVKVDPDDWMIEFRLKATGAYRWLPLASMWKTRLRALVSPSVRTSPTHAASRTS